MSKTNMKRRTFLKFSTLAGSGLLVGCSFSSTKIISNTNLPDAKLGMWVRIDEDEKINLVVPASEMGQHAHTGQAMLVAEELEVKWDKINVLTAPFNSEYKIGWGSQSTGGSGSIQKWWTKLRQIGASSRLMLIEAAASKWEVPSSECYAKEGIIIHKKTNRELSYGQVCNIASTITAIDDPPLKQFNEFKFIGKSLQKIHTTSKTNGKAVYGIDIRIKGMLFAAVRQSPVFGGKVSSYNEKEAKTVKGVNHIVKIPNGIAVVANSTWEAQKGLSLLNPKFEGGESIGVNNQTINEAISRNLDEIGKSDDEYTKSLDVEYQMPYLHHATMEPMNCTAFVQEDFCEVWVPTQHQTKTQKAIKEVTGFSDEKIKINTTLMGGAFGRRLEVDFVIQAVTISKILKKPIQVLFDREEDTKHGFYRPISTSRFQIQIGTDGLPVKWENQTVQPNLLARSAPPLRWFDFDPFAVGGSVHDYPVLQKHFYEIENINLKHKGVELGIPIGSWRAPPNSINVFYIESVIDELAFLSKIDPAIYRLRLIKNSQRHRNVLEKVIDKSGWFNKTNKEYGLGIAINDWIPIEEKKSIVALIAKVHVSKKGKLKVEKVDCVIDCGIVINPDSVIAQVEGSIIMGLSAALFEEITIDNGSVEQSNFDDYRIARMKDAPEINVSIVDSNLEPTGTGEPASSPIVPAITNAIFAATGKRIRKLPIGKQKLV